MGRRHSDDFVTADHGQSTSSSSSSRTTTTTTTTTITSTANTAGKTREDKNHAAADMSKLAPSLKALINAPFARPGQCASPARIRDVYQSIAREAIDKQLGHRPWLAISAATTFTLNSPDSLSVLHAVSSAQRDASPVHDAEFIREVGLKCISFNGIPRTINSLNAFHAALPADVRDRLSTKPTRQPTPANVDEIRQRGRALWDSVYAPFQDKLYEKLARAHPDLPVHILNSHYGALLADPPAQDRGELAGQVAVGRVLTSVVAVSCLRAQTGVGPQVLSHVFGLRKGVADGTFEADRPAESEAAVRWLAGDEGSEWILKSVDRIAEALGDEGAFAPTRQSKL